MSSHAILCKKTCLGRVALGKKRSEEGIGVATLSSSNELLVSHEALATIGGVDGLICSLNHEQCAGVDWIYGIHGCQIQIACKSQDIRLIRQEYIPGVSTGLISPHAELTCFCS